MKKKLKASPAVRAAAMPATGPQRVVLQPTGTNSSSAITATPKVSRPMMSSRAVAAATASTAGQTCSRVFSLLDDRVLSMGSLTLNHVQRPPDQVDDLDCDKGRHHPPDPIA